jgi:hypothetical protein
MTRLEAIVAHLKKKGAFCGYTLVTDQMTEMIFRNLVPSVRVRLYKDGIIEILFASELCGGGNLTPTSSFPELNWVLQTIDKECKLQPSTKSAEA